MFITGNQELFLILCVKELCLKKTQELIGEKTKKFIEKIQNKLISLNLKIGFSPIRITEYQIYPFQE
jgi:hypothetical protein